ncbi:MAG TPA: glycosyltransferase [Anaerolineaceae bacterium]|nr:glycosyltransferase [Anaerolineaceae bacterium]
MKITITALGSRGDIQPYLALAVGLQAAGHQVTLAAPQIFSPWIESYGVTAHAVNFDPQTFLQRPEVQAILKSRNIFSQLRRIFKEMNEGTLQTLDDFWAAEQNADFVVAGAGGLGGAEVPSQLGIPMAYSFLWPAVATRAFPAFMLPQRASLGGLYNYLSAEVFSRAAWPMTSKPINQWRASRLGLPPWRSGAEMLKVCEKFNTQWLFAFSPSLLPKPPDWKEFHHVTGYWFLDPPPDWTPPPGLLNFLESGPPPVYIGFGSMNQQDPQRTTRLALRALELSGQRGLLLTGWGGIARMDAPANVFFADNVPHAWLFPRMAAVVHHGGAGTTAAGLRAGIPGILTPLAGDQSAWADLVVKAGVGPRAPSMKKLTPEKLAAAITRAVADPEMRARAAALGEKIRAEDGISRAIEVIEGHVLNHHPNKDIPSTKNTAASNASIQPNPIDPYLRILGVHS